MVTMNSYAVLYSSRWDTDLANNQEVETTLVIPQNVSDEVADLAIHLQDFQIYAITGYLYPTVSNTGPFPHWLSGDQHHASGLAL
jgi:hypothetical protein